MKFLHAADLHLDSPLRTQAARDSALGATLRAASRQVLSRIVDAAIEERVDAVLLAGDTFDNGVVDVRSRAALATEAQRLERAGIPLVLIQGNHDALIDLARYGPISDALILLTADRPSFDIGEATLHGIGFSAAKQPDSLLPRYPAPHPGRINVGLMHTSIEGATGHDPYAPCRVADLLAHGYDYWALGHIHKRSEYRGDEALAVMPGIPQGRSIRETDGGSATLVEIDLSGVRTREVPLALLDFVQVTVDLTGAADQGKRSDTIATALRLEAEPDRSRAIRLTLTGDRAALGDPAMTEALARDAVQGIDRLFIETIRVVPRARTTEDGEDIPDDLTRLMEADAAGPGFRDEVKREIEDLRAILPPDARDSLDEDLDALIAEGVEAVALRLTSGSGQ